MTGRTVRVYNIRAGRPRPGLRPQHLLSARAVAEISGGELDGAHEDSTELVFRPGAVNGGSYSFDVASFKSSAGSVGLVFQTICLPLCFAHTGSRVVIKGGTHVEWSPPVDYIKEVFLPAVGSMGVEAGIDLLRWGFYPIGGGMVDVTVRPSRLPLRPFRVVERGRLRRVAVLSAVANLPVDIARRQLERTMERLRDASFEAEGRRMSVPSPGRGTFLFILAEFDNTRAGFSALGARGKRAEAVADEAVDSFLEYMKSPAAVDRHLADQILIAAALAGGDSVFTTAGMTGHLATNVRVIERFLPVRFSIEDGGVCTVKVRGAALGRP